MIDVTTQYARVLRVLFGVALAWSTTVSSGFSAPQGLEAGAKPGGAETSNHVKIGFIVPLSGVGEGGGKAMVKGMNLYLDQINHQMGGRKVDLLVENEESSPVTAIAKMRKLIQDDKVDVLAGGYLANVAYAIASKLDTYKIPFIDVVSGADDLTQRKRSKWIARISWTSSQVAHPMGDYAYKTLKYKKVVTVGTDYAYGYEVVGGFQKVFEACGGQVIQKLWVPMGHTDFKDILKQIRPDADAVFIVTVGPQGVIISKEYRELGLKLPIIGTGGTQFDEIQSLTQVGEELLGGIHSDPYTMTLETPANQAFLSAYRRKYNEDPGFFSECGYVAAKWLHKAIDTLHGDVQNRDKLMAAIKGVELKDAPRGDLKLDTYGNIVDNIYITKVEKIDGRYRNKVIFTYPLVSQFWKWKPEEYLKQPPYTKSYPPCTHCSVSN